MEKTLKLLVPLVVALLCIRTAVCVSTAAPLSCETCMGTNNTDLNCESKPCNKGETMCYAQTILEIDPNGIRNDTQKAKGCATAESCPKPGTYILSATMKDFETRGAIDCCTCDNCNKEFPPVPPKSPGFRTCTNCDPGENVQVLSTNCNALETHCFRSKERKCKPNSPPDVHFGCASEEFCKKVAAYSSGVFICDHPDTPRCQMCSGSCDGPNPKVVLVPLRPGMKCFSATIEETFRGCTSVRTLRGMTAAAGHMCQKRLWSALVNSGNTRITMKCCAFDNCNQPGIEEFFGFETVKTISEELLPQLNELLHEGHVFFPPPAAAAAPEESTDNGFPDDGLQSTNVD